MCFLTDSWTFCVLMLVNSPPCWQMVFLPEACDYMSESKQESVSQAGSIHGPQMTRYCQLAREAKIWLSLGGLHIKVSTIIQVTVLFFASSRFIWVNILTSQLYICSQLLWKYINILSCSFIVRNVVWPRYSYKLERMGYLTSQLMTSTSQSSLSLSNWCSTGDWRWQEKCILLHTLFSC